MVMRLLAGAAVTGSGDEIMGQSKVVVVQEEGYQDRIPSQSSG